MIAFLALIAWRFVFAGLHRRPLVRAIAPQQQRHNNVIEERLHISDPGGLAVIGGNRFENSADGLDPFAIDMSAGCETGPIPDVHTRKLAFIPCT